MDEASPPLTFNELIQLTNLGIPLEHITWPRATMCSDEWICIRHGNTKDTGTVLDKRESIVTILNPYKAAYPQSWKTTAGSVKMNPTKALIALKAGLRFQVYNIESRQLLYKQRMPAYVVYWTWINSEVIAIVTETAVYHWSLNDGDVQKMFSCTQRLVFAEIVNYMANEDLKWLALVGLAPEENVIMGLTHLFSIDNKLSQPISAHAVCFTQYQFHWNQSPSTVLVAVNRHSGDRGKVHVVELGPHIKGNAALTNHSESIKFQPLYDKYDFPVSVQVSPKYGLIFIVTKYGHFYLCDLETALCLCSTQVCPSILFAATLNSETQGILGIGRNGQVLSIDIKKDGLVQYVREVVKRPAVAERLEKVISR